MMQRIKFKAQTQTKKIVSLLSTSLVLSLALFPSTLLKPKPTWGAERIVFEYPPVDLYMSVRFLEEFVKTGKITGDFALYASLIKDKSQLKQLRQVLGQNFKVSPELMTRLTKMPLAQPLYRRIGQVIQVNQKTNGSEAIRAALITVASQPDGFTILDVIKQFPDDNIRINTQLILQLAEEIPILLDYRTAATNAVIEEAEREAANEPPMDFSNLPNIREQGPYNLIKKELSFPVRNLRQTEVGLATSYQLDVDVFVPEGLSEPAPVIISSHGFGSYRGHNSLAKHLASHGFVVATPEHIGSSLGYREGFLRGDVDLLLSPIEYLSRPLDGIYLLDHLEKLVKTDPFWKKAINLQQVGVIGNSFGGTTALALAGAEITSNRIRQQCVQDIFTLNISLLLQCRTVHLPPLNYNFRDPRVKAVVAAHPLTSAIYGPEGMSQVEVPILMVAGANDIITPVIQEQIHPFIWLKSPQKYLSLLVPGTHFSSTLRADTKGVSSIPKFIIGTNFDLGRPYFFGLSVAFFKVYLDENSTYRPFLSSSYSQSISQEELSPKMIQSLSLEQLETAYGGPPPEPLMPRKPILSALLQKPRKTILEEVKKTGVLKVAMRRDAVPFGYLDDKQNWTGYCSQLMNSFAAYLTEELNTPVEVELVRLPSTIDNRFQMVRTRTVDLECGPNSIVSNVSGVTFSEPFFVTGTQFLVKTNNETQIQPDSDLNGVKTGIVKNTTTEQFVRQRYPQTETLYFRGENSISNAIQALINDQIDTFANDGILTIGELMRQRVSMENYKLVPEQPLTCEFYGLILPDNDPQWRKTVDTFINDDKADEVWQEWFTDAFPYVFLNLESCFNR